MVIIPDPTLRMNEVGLPYQAFRVLYKYRIIYHLMTNDDISLAAAYTRWQSSLKFDQHVYDIMNYILETENPMILINRNPTLNLYSLLRMKIAYIKTPEKKETLSLPETILTGLNADQPISNKVRVHGNMHVELCERLTSGVCYSQRIAC
jgi:DNA-directed RNA polymerase beta' subunit